jgi:hypothetical protein
MALWLFFKRSHTGSTLRGDVLEPCNDEYVIESPQRGEPVRHGTVQHRDRAVLLGRDCKTGCCRTVMGAYAMTNIYWQMRIRAHHTHKLVFHRCLIEAKRRGCLTH